MLSGWYVVRLPTTYTLGIHFNMNSSVIDWISHNITILRLMPQSHPTTGPERFLSPVRFLVRKADFYVGAVSVVTSGYGPRTAWDGCILMFGLNSSQDSTGKPTPCDARAGIVRPRTGIFNVFHILRDPYWARAWPARVPYGALTDAFTRELTQP